MLSIRQMASLIWAVTAFMLAAALVLNLRYKSLAEGSGYVDTWTGELRTSSEELQLASADECNDRVVAIDTRRAGFGELSLRVEHFRRSELPGSDCKGVCFAFPAR